MAGTDAKAYWDDRGLLLLWLGVLSGPAGWALNQLVGYALVKPACTGKASVMLLLVAAVALAVIIAGGVLSWSCVTKLRGANETGGGVADRSLLLAVTGVALNALLGVLVLTAAVSPFLLSPCE